MFSVEFIIMNMNEITTLAINIIKLLKLLKRFYLKNMPKKMKNCSFK